MIRRESSLVLNLSLFTHIIVAIKQGKLKFKSVVYKQNSMFSQFKRLLCYHGRCLFANSGEDKFVAQVRIWSPALENCVGQNSLKRDNYC